MSINRIEGTNGQVKNSLAWLASIIVRILAVAIAYALVARLIGLLLGELPSLSLAYSQNILASLIAGIAIALVLLPLARRLPYRMGTRILVLFLPLYWTALLGNLVEAYFYFTNMTLSQLAVRGILDIIPYLVACWLVVRLLPAYEQAQTVPGIWQTLRERPLFSWIWRIVVIGLLFAVFIVLFGTLLNLSKDYADPAITSQLHTKVQPLHILLIEETTRGIIFTLTLLPVLVVMRGRSWSKLLSLALYIALFDAVFESWAALLLTSPLPLAFRLGETVDLTLDALARGILIALLLALPALISQRQHAADEPVS
jgi:hypothetical protein